MKFTTLLLTLLSAMPVVAAPDGDALFKANCAACHILDQMIVGPSLVEIRTLYKDKPEDFIKWCNVPGKKRQNVIEMPSMVHVGGEGLQSIYGHIMKVSAGAKEQKMQKGDPFVASPSHTTRPYVQRIFMPDAGPAAMAVALDDQTSLCWDAGECRFRYAWTGGFIDGFPYWQGNGSSLAKVVGNITHREDASPLSKILQGKTSFHGYSLTKGLPTFRYHIGSCAVTESYAPSSTGKGYQQTFTLNPAASQPLSIPIPQVKGMTVTCAQGVIENNTLIIPAATTSNFTIIYQLP